MNAQDVLHAWRDFECSFFAGALLCPKIPFRRFLNRERYRVEAGEKMELTPAVVMRRMTKVSPYPYWHFFDAYPPGYLRAVYRGNGIPLPWGNMAQVSDPCPHWAVFRMLDEKGSKRRGSQISVLRDGDRSLLYCCHSQLAHDMAGNPHVISVGVDLVPALQSHVANAEEIVASITDACLQRHGEAKIPRGAEEALQGVARVLNIAWVEEALLQPARIICPRSSHCPRLRPCDSKAALRGREITDVREEILGKLKLQSRVSLIAPLWRTATGSVERIERALQKHFALRQVRAPLALRPQHEIVIAVLIHLHAYRLAVLHELIVKYGIQFEQRVARADLYQDWGSNRFDVPTRNLRIRRCRSEVGPRSGRHFVAKEPDGVQVRPRSRP